MADVTINDLPLGIINNSTIGFIPTSINNQTVRLPISAIPDAQYYTPNKPFIIAYSNNPNNMGKLGSSNTGAFVANEATINTIHKYTGTSNTMLNPSTYEITVPKTGIYLIQPVLQGYVPDSNYNIRAGAIIVNVNGVSDFITNYNWFSCVFAGGTNTHFRWAPTLYYPLNAGDKLKMYYGMYGGTNGYNAGFYALEHCYITVCMV
jgi:hypothetical protein